MRDIFIISLILLIILVSCSPSKSVASYQAPQETVDKVQYDVSGVGEEYFSARENSIYQGLEKACVDIIGKVKFEVNKGLIISEIKARRLLNKLFEFHSTNIGSKDGKKLVEGYVIVDVRGLKEFLNSLPLDSDKKPEKPQVVAKPKEKEQEVVIEKVEKVAPGKKEVVEDEEVEVSDLSSIKDMVFLVLPPDSKLASLKDDEDLKLFIEVINSELSRLGLVYIDLNRIIDLSKKFSMIYEEKTGEAMSIAQLVAQEVKAPVYLEVDANFSPKLVSGNYVELNTSVTIKAYDASTGKGLGVIPFGKEVKSSKGLNQTKIEIMRASARVGITKILHSIENYFSSGVSISVRVIGFKGVPGEKDFSNFLDSLPGINSKKRRSISGNLAEYEINYKGGVSAFVDDLIDRASMDTKYSDISIDQSGNLVIITIK